MAIEFKRKRVEFLHARGSLAVKKDKVEFQAPIERVEAAISGFQIQFEGSEHPVQNMQASVKNNVSFDKRTASIEVELGIKDNTGYYDDKYGGWVDVLFIANLK